MKTDFERWQYAMEQVRYNLDQVKKAEDEGNSASHNLTDAVKYATIAQALRD